MNINPTATQTGGAAITLSFAGINSGKSTYVGPGHSRLEPQSVEFTTQNGTPNKANPGTAKVGMKVTFANRLAEEGCCTVVPGSVIVDLGIRWDLSQPESLVDDIIGYLRGLSYSSELSALIKDGILPTS